MKTICIYHANCFDGICAAWVVSKKYPDAEFVPMNHGQDIIAGEKGELYNLPDYDCIMVDFSFPRERMIELNKLFNTFLVIDHHKTAEENCKGLDFCKFDMNESGASLAWKHYFPNDPLPLLVRYIKDRDLWLFKEEESEYVNAFIHSYSMDIRWYDHLREVLENDFEAAVADGAAITRYKNQMVSNICDTAVIWHTEDGKIPTVNTAFLFSEVGAELCKRFPESPYSQYYFDRLKDNTRQWGFRSDGRFDVSEVAKRRGGGGHKTAAGCQHPIFWERL